MAIVLGLVIAVLFGSGDFFGGIASKKTSVLYVIGFSHVIGLVGALAVAPLIADLFTWVDFGIGMLAGACGGIGVALLYRGLARGPMAVVAPITAIMSAAVPAIYGVVQGESLSTAAWIGICGAILAIGLTSIPLERGQTPVAPAVVLESLLAGIGFGILFVLLDATNDAAAPWPVVGARFLTSGVLLTIIIFFRREGVSTAKPAARSILLAGIFDTASNVLFVIATTLGALPIVAVLSSLYPASTVVLARFVLDERMSKVQVAGLAVALASTVLIALG